MKLHSHSQDINDDEVHAFVPPANKILPELMLTKFYVTIGR